MATYLLIGMVVTLIGMIAVYCFKLFCYNNDDYKSDLDSAIKHTPQIFAALLFGWPIALVVYFMFILICQSEEL